MTPRTKMFTLPAKMLLFDAMPLISENLHSRIPIFGKTHDDIVGFVHVRDILTHLEKDNKMITLEQVSRKPVFASQEKMVSSLLKEMKGRKTHMAIVIDEHGGVEGLVTLEDLIEEIVGDIEDETDDTPPKEFESVDKDTIITNGDIKIDLINEINLNISICNYCIFVDRFKFFWWCVICFIFNVSDYLFYKIF